MCFFSMKMYKRTTLADVKVGHVDRVDDIVYHTLSILLRLEPCKQLK